QLTLRPAGQSPLAHHVERATALPDRPHGVVDAAAAEPCLRDAEPLAGAAEQRVAGHAHLVVTDVGVNALVQVVTLGHGGYVALDLDSGRVRRDDEHRHALVRPRVRVGD